MCVSEMPERVLPDSRNVLYFGDNGRCFCGHHAGMSAAYTGMDISGQEVEKITPESLELCKGMYNFVPVCETCKIKS